MSTVGFFFFQGLPSGLHCVKVGNVGPDGLPVDDVEAIGDVSKWQGAFKGLHRAITLNEQLS